MGRLMFKIFAVLLALFHVSQAVTLSLKSYLDGPGGPDNPEVYGYRGVATVSTTPMTEETFMQEVAAAALQMYNLHVRLSGGIDDGACPKAMTGVTMDRRTIYFHSSVKGAGATSVITLLGNGASQEVRDALARCNAAAEEADFQKTGRRNAKRHINEANCGEIMATNYYTQQTTRNIGTAPSPNKWVVTYASDGQTLLEPCSDTFHNINYGCLQYVAQLGFAVCPSPQERQRQEDAARLARWTLHQEQLGQYWYSSVGQSPDPRMQAWYSAAYTFYSTNRYWPEKNWDGQPLAQGRRKMKRALSQSQIRTAVLNMLKGVCPNTMAKLAKLPPACKPPLMVQTKKVGTKMVPVFILDPKTKVKQYKCVPDPKAPKCTATQKLVNGKCVPDPTKPAIKCLATQTLVGGKCVPKPATKCLPTQKLVGGKCVPNTTGTVPKCTALQELFKNKCVLKCKLPKKRNARTGGCA